MRLKTPKTTPRLCWSGASAAVPGVAQLAGAPQFEAVRFEAVPPIVAERSFEAEPLQPVAALMLAEDIVIRTTNIAVAALMLAGSLVAALPFIVAVRTQEVGLLPAAEAHMSPTAVADAVGNK